MFQVDGAAGSKAGGRKELGTFKTGKEVRAGMQGQGLGEGEGHTEALSQRALRNLTGAAKELAFPPGQRGPPEPRGKQEGAGMQERAQLPAPRGSLLMSGCHFPTFFPFRVQ